MPLKQNLLPTLMSIVLVVSCIGSDVMHKLHSIDGLTQVKVVVVGITEEHESTNDVSNG